MSYQNKRKMVPLTAAAMLLALFVGLGHAFAQASSDQENDYEWAIYVYLCGTDLESKYGAATKDLHEIMKVTLPDNVKLVIQTGGTKKWHNDFVDPSKICRFVYDSNGMQLESTAPLANMGDQRTLEDFLNYCLSNHPAKRSGVIFWNHGGGTLFGVCFDERYNSDALDLAELARAFHPKGQENRSRPPFEFIGFDACLMASIDTASMFYGAAKYMVASEEVEPGNGWYYTGWLKELAAKPAMDGAELGKAICDSYMHGCKLVGTESLVTLSVIDLSGIPKLQQALGDFGLEGFMNVLNEPVSFFASYARNTSRAGLYGDGKYEMVDLGDLMRQNADLFPNTSAAVLQALDEAVVYNVKSSYRNFASGISCYYPQSKSLRSYKQFYGFSTTPAYAFLYEYMLTGRLGEEAIEYYSEMIAYYSQMDAESAHSSPEQAGSLMPTFPGTSTPLPNPSIIPTLPGGTASSTPLFPGFSGDETSPGTPLIPDFPVTVAPASIIPFLPETPPSSISQLEEHPVSIKDDTWAVLEISADHLEQVSDVNFLLAKIIDDETILYLGQDNDIEADWDNGVFTDNFRGVWGSIDGHLVYMELSYQGDSYVLYDVPILINGEPYTLKTSYGYKDERYHILTATPVTEDGEPAPKEQYLLQSGDQITTLLAFVDIESAELDYREHETFAFTAESNFGEMTLGEGIYLLMFDMEDYRGESAQSEVVLVTIDEEGDMTLEKTDS